MAVGENLQEVGKNLNPFGWVQSIGSLSGSYLSGPVEFIAANSLGLLYQDQVLAYMAVMLFVMSLLIATIVDHINMTSGLRTIMLKVHFALLKAVRCVVMIGLFFLGKAVGSAGSFADGLAAGRDMVVTIASLFFVQKIVESLSMTVQGLTYYSKYNAANVPAGGSGLVPFVKGYNWLQTFMQVLRDYLDQVTQTSMDSIIGISRAVGADLTVKDVDGSTANTISANNGAPLGIKYIWQANGITFRDVNGSATGFDRNDQSAYSIDGTGANIGSFNLLYSPFFVGLAIGLLK
jgi:hypothetical protein